ELEETDGGTRPERFAWRPPTRAGPGATGTPAVLRDPRREAAERRYRQLALEACDIIDLANLPENDRHIATRQLELRRLYVAFRVLPERGGGSRGSRGSGVALNKPDMRNFVPAKADVTGLPLGQVLQEHQRVVILGDPGA